MTFLDRMLVPIPTVDKPFNGGPFMQERGALTRTQSFSATPKVCEHAIKTAKMHHVQYDLKVKGGMNDQPIHTKVESSGIDKKLTYEAFIYDLYIENLTPPRSRCSSLTSFLGCFRLTCLDMSVFPP